MRRFIRETAFKMARQDVSLFLKDHEAHILYIFRQEMERIDEELPEERLFIDIKMVPLGEVILKAALKTICRFLEEGPEQLSPPPSE
jgi:hypothetical protein